MVIEKRIVNFTSVWLVTLGHTSHLYMAALRSIFAELDSQVALHDLHMVKVHLQHQIMGADFLENVVGLGLRVEKESRYIACVDRFNQKGYALFCEFSGGEFEVGDVGSISIRGTHTLWDNTGHGMELCRVQFLRLLNGGRHSNTEFFFAARPTRRTTFASGPIAWG